jgi:hypothetical protein
MSCKRFCGTQAHGARSGPCAANGNEGRSLAPTRQRTAVTPSNWLWVVTRDHGLPNRGETGLVTAQPAPGADRPGLPPPTANRRQRLRGSRQDGEVIWAPRLTPGRPCHPAPIRRGVGRAGPRPADHNDTIKVEKNAGWFKRIRRNARRHARQGQPDKGGATAGRIVFMRSDGQSLFNRNACK